MRVAVVHTEKSPCRCHDAIAGALTRGGHEAVVLGAEELLRRGALAVAGIRVAFDHTDTVEGAGRRRNEPRRLLELAGVQVAGGTAESCELADDKVRSWQRMKRQRVPVPNGFILDDAEACDPEGLRWPRILKAPHEHMSRGVAIVRDVEELRARAKAFLAEFGSPLLLQEYIEGRELAVSIWEPVAGETDFLPIIEWRVEGGMLTEAEKLSDGCAPFIAKLSRPAMHRVDEAAWKAYRALGLRDYARVDLRLDEERRPWVLEVNPRPSVEPGSPTAISVEASRDSFDEFIEYLRESAALRAEDD